MELKEISQVCRQYSVHQAIGYDLCSTSPLSFDWLLLLARQLKNRQPMTSSMSQLSEGPIEVLGCVVITATTDKSLAHAQGRGRLAWLVAAIRDLSLQHRIADFE